MRMVSVVTVLAVTLLSSYAIADPPSSCDPKAFTPKPEGANVRLTFKSPEAATTAAQWVANAPATFGKPGERAQPLNAAQRATSRTGDPTLLYPRKYYPRVQAAIDTGPWSPSDIGGAALGILDVIGTINDLFRQWDERSCPFPADPARNNYYDYDANKVKACRPYECKADPKHCTETFTASTAVDSDGDGYCDEETPNVLCDDDTPAPDGDKSKCPLAPTDTSGDNYLEERCFLSAGNQRVPVDCPNHYPAGNDPDMEGGGNGAPVLICAAHRTCSKGPLDTAFVCDPWIYDRCWWITPGMY